MFKHYMQSTFRNIKNKKFFSFINIIGLSIGISACILVSLYVIEDLSYDKFNKNIDRIYRVHFEIQRTDDLLIQAQTPAKLGETLKNNYPEIKNFTRIYFSNKMLIESSSSKYFENNLAFADSSFFDIFSLEFVVGESKRVLERKNTLLLTVSAKKKYFGDENPVGKSLVLNGKYNFEVVGVVKDLPNNSHFKFDMLASYNSLENLSESVYLNQWGATFGSYTYVLVNDHFNIKKFEQKTENFFTAYTNVMSGKKWSLSYMPLRDIHLKSHLADEIKPNSSVSKILLLGSIAFCILLLACINYINLSTARSVKRLREIGIRKVLGAFKKQIVTQFLCESVFIVFIAFLISILIVLLILPNFSSFAGVEVKINSLFQFHGLFYSILAVFLIGILAGLYPSFFISSYKPINILKNNTFNPTSMKSSNFLRKSMVILQFVISIALITATIVVTLQNDFMQNFNMGFQKNNMIVIPAYSNLKNNYSTIKNELLNVNGIVSVTACESSPIGQLGMDTECKPEGYDSLKAFSIYVKSVDNNFMNQFGVEFVAGGNFLNNFNSQENNCMLINEKMAKSLGYDNPENVIGKSFFISLNGYTPQVIGVVKDFHYSSLHNELQPQVFMFVPKWFSEFVVQVNSSNIDKTLKDVQNIWLKFFPEYPFEYKFLDESIDAMYRAESRFASLIYVFSFIAVFIACLGLLGLTAIVTELKKKEIGIRKVLGASTVSILKGISKEFVYLIIFSILIAYPFTYYFVNKWLQHFVYKINLTVWPFLLAGLMGLIVAMATVSFHALKAATAKPVESLKYE